MADKLGALNLNKKEMIILLSLKEIEYLENTISKEIAMRRNLITKLDEQASKAKTDLQKAHFELAIRKHKDRLNTHVDVFGKLRSLGGY